MVLTVSSEKAESCICVMWHFLCCRLARTKREVLASRRKSSVERRNPKGQFSSPIWCYSTWSIDGLPFLSILTIANKYCFFHTFCSMLERTSITGQLQRTIAWVYCNSNYSWTTDPWSFGPTHHRQPGHRSMRLELSLPIHAKLSSNCNGWLWKSSLHQIFKPSKCTLLLILFYWDICNPPSL